jgi:putative peptide zinc metalloprotease protein
VSTVGPEQAALLRPDDVAAVPRLARGVELLGPYRGSGFENPPYLVRRGGSVLQVSRLLHVVAAAIDGRHAFDEIAALAGAELDRRLSADDVRYLVETALVPAGIVGCNDAGPQPSPLAADERVLALRFRWPLLGSEDVGTAARFLTPLFRPSVVIATLAALLAFDGWVFAVHGVTGALEQALRQPAALLFIVALTLLATAFHEFGHAAGCLYSGARPGVVGAGIYLVWPVMFTDVTDAYRLDRAGRLRTDLGGIYFNAVFTVGLACAYATTHFELLLTAVVVQHVVVLDQLMPWVRFDGYYVLSDLTGVPDILDRVRPALRSLVPGRPPDAEILALRPRSRRILLAYLGSLAVVVAVALVSVVRDAPDLLATDWRSLVEQLHALAAAIGMWDVPGGLVIVLEIAVLAAPVAGLALMVAVVAGRVKNTVRPPGGRIRRATRSEALQSA